jgi:CRISPR-associated protein Cas5d
MPPEQLRIPFLVRLRVWGDRACFTRPEMKAERLSYDVMTPSAARGVLEAIYWKPQIAWRIDRIHVLSPIRFSSVRRNEVASPILETVAREAMKSGRGRLALYADDDRQQRATTHLRDVDYVVEAHFVLVERSESAAKHFDVARRRIERGQTFHHPYLGCREFPASFSWVESAEAIPPPPDELRGERDLGYMLHDIDHPGGRTPRFFPARLLDGVLDVPPWNPEEAIR